MYTNLLVYPLARIINAMHFNRKRIILHLNNIHHFRNIQSFFVEARALTDRHTNQHHNIFQFSFGRHFIDNCHSNSIVFMNVGLKDSYFLSIFFFFIYLCIYIYIYIYKDTNKNSYALRPVNSNYLKRILAMLNYLKEIKIDIFMTLLLVRYDHYRK